VQESAVVAVDSLEGPIQSRTTHAESPTGRNLPPSSPPDQRAFARIAADRPQRPPKPPAAANGLAGRLDETSDYASRRPGTRYATTSGAAPDGGALTRLAEGSRPSRTLTGPKADQPQVPGFLQYEPGRHWRRPAPLGPHGLGSRPPAHPCLSVAAVHISVGSRRTLTAADSWGRLASELVPALAWPRRRGRAPHREMLGAVRRSGARLPRSRSGARSCGLGCAASASSRSVLRC